MNDTAAPEIRLLGQNAASHVAGARSVKQVGVSLVGDSQDRPAYLFTFVIDQSVADKPAGLLRIRLQQKLRDELDAIGDPHIVIIQMLDDADWERHALAGAA